MRKECLSRIRLGLAAVLLLLMCFVIEDVTPIQAAEQPVTVSSCKLNSSGSKLTVEAKVKKKTKSMGKKLYLLNLNAYNSETGKKSVKPLASVKTKKGTITFKVKYNSSMLYQKFVVAYKTKGKYQIVSDARYITNPEVLAAYKGKGPKAASKKGLQVEHLSDSLELGTQHAVINWTLNSLLNNDAINKETFKYKGKTYCLDADQIRKNDELVQAYNAAGVRVTVILLLPKDAASTGTSSMQYGGYSYTKFSSVKTSSKTGCRTFEAIMTYLAKRYSTKQNLVCGWILGNEINSPCVWNYGGGKSLNSYVKDYARSFRICYNAVKSCNKNANVYVSLDNNWTRDLDGKKNSYFGSKSVLDTFYKKIKAQGNIVFQIAYHAYPQGMSDPVFWDDSMATNSTKAKIINFKNLRVLTNYVKKNFGKKYTIMLSEQSFNSNRGELVQAAAYAYAYYISESNSMIEAFIYGREIDHPEEIQTGYRWGLCDNWYAKRLIWHVFQYIDSKDSFKFTDPLVKYTDLKKWSKVSGFNKTKYSKMKSKRQKGAITDITPVSSTSVTLTWKKLDQGDGYEIFRDGKLIASVAENFNVTYTDTGLAKGSTHKYQIRMYKEAPNAKNPSQKVRLYGEKSSAVSVTLTAGQVVLETKKCVVSGKEITVAWKKMTDVDGFEILRSTAENGNYSVVGSVAGNKTSYKDKNTQSGTTYYYRVRAYVKVNGTNYYGKNSDAVAKQALIQLSAEIVNGEIVLNWTQWQNATKYRVYCTTESANDFKRLKNVEGLTYRCKEYIDSSGAKISFEEGEEYLFRVRYYIDGDHRSPYSNTVSIKIQEGDMISSTGASEEETESDDTENQETTTETETPSTETTTETETQGTEAETTTEIEIPSTETETKVQNIRL